MESQEVMDTDTDTEPGAEEEIEVIEIIIDTDTEEEREEILPDVEVETGVRLPPLIPPTIAPKAPILVETVPEQQVLFVHGTETDQTIILIPVSGQDPSDPSRPLTFKRATLTTQLGSDISSLQRGKQVVNISPTKILPLKPAGANNSTSTLADTSVLPSGMIQKSTHQSMLSPKARASPLMEKAWCTVCRKLFYNNSSLRGHIKKFHPDKLIELLGPLKRNRINKVTCNGSGEFFSRHSNLTRHVKQFHPDKIRELTQQKEYNYLCDKCGKNFIDMENLQRHNEMHYTESTARASDGAVKMAQNLKCPICRNDENYEKSEIRQHFEIYHDIKLSSENLQFSSENEFASWKSQLEKETHCYFTIEHGFDSTKGYKRKKFTCHRSGMYTPSGSGIRNLKAQGTNKISGYCPAEIVLKMFRNGECEVEFVNVHVGHDQDLGHVTLSKSDRESIAAKIAAKVPYKKILDEVREESTSESKFERIHLLKRKDLHNISQCFNLDSEAVKNPMSDAWIKEIEDRECVLFYKPRNTFSEAIPELEPDDFLLIIMSRGQAELLQKYGSDIVCIDRTYGLDSYQFELITLLVVDDMREAIPTAFLISNRTDEAVMSIFFSVISEKLGRNLEPNIFMSDLDESFYNAWLQIMGPAEFRLICSWHVDRDWRENLSQINGEKKQIEVYKNLRILLQETDESSFVQMCSAFMEYLLSDSVTEEFGAYFQENYLNDVQSWAYCYRINLGINTNLNLEWMHQTLKQLKRICFSGKAIKGLDEAIDALIKFVHDKLFDRLLVINRVKIYAKIKALRSRHRASEKLDDRHVNETESGFEVQSSPKSEVYFVQERQPTCDCETLCPECQICLHRYSCTCIDSCIRLNMCKHIHLVCRLLQKHNTTNTQVVDINSPIESDDQNQPNCEQQEICYEAPTPTLVSGKEKNEADDVDGVKEKLALKLHKIIADIKSPEELNAIEKLIAPIEPTLVSMREKDNTVFSSRAPNNGKIIVERIEVISAINSSL